MSCNKENNEADYKAKSGDQGFPFHHHYPIQIRFNDIDPLGHVNNAVYFPLFDLGKAKYFETVTDGKVDWKHVNIVIANVNCNFLAPIFFNEPIEVQTQVTEIGNSSFRVFQRLVNTEDSEVKCTCATIMVGFDVKKQCKAPLNQEWVTALNEFEQRNLRRE